MTLDLQAATPPLEIDAQGIARVRGTRISLELLVDAFADGSSAEELAPRYPTLAPADAVLAYLLRDPAGVEADMEERARHEADVRQSLAAEMTRIREC